MYHPFENNGRPRDAIYPSKLFARQPNDDVVLSRSFRCGDILRNGKRDSEDKRRSYATLTIGVGNTQLLRKKRQYVTVGEYFP